MMRTIDRLSPLDGAYPRRAASGRSKRLNRRTKRAGSMAGPALLTVRTIAPSQVSAASKMVGAWSAY